MSDADKFASMDMRHDLCDQLPCWECQTDLDFCIGCGSRLYSGKFDDCYHCLEFLKKADNV